MPTTFINGSRDATGFESITVSTVSIGGTAALLKSDQGEATELFVTVESQAVRYRLDGAAPTATVGHQLEAGDSMVVTGADNIRRLRFIRRDGTNATLRVTYYK